MNDALLERLLNEGESSSLDYKQEQYPFDGASDEQKSELLKDILALANGWRHAEGYILIGVEEAVGDRTIVHGVEQHLHDNNLQQFVNSKTNRTVAFSCKAYRVDGKQIGIIEVAQQDRPTYIKSDFGKLKKATVYYRQGTATAIATPEQIAKMGTPVDIKKLIEGQRDEPKKEQIKADLGFDTSGSVYVDVYNSGDLEVYIKEVALIREDKDESKSPPFDISTVSVPLLAATELPVADGKGSSIRVALGQKTCDILPRKQARFVLPRCPSSVIQHFIAKGPESLALSIRTFGGEISRLGGDRVHSLLSNFVAILQSIEEAEKPKLTVVRFYRRHNGSAVEEVGTVKVHSSKRSSDGLVHFRVGDASPGLTFSEDDGRRLVEALRTNTVIGEIGEYEWRIE